MAFGAALLASSCREAPPARPQGALRFWRPDGTTWVEVASMPMGRCLALRFDGAGEHLAVMCEREVVVVDLGTRLASSRITSPHSEVMTAFDLSANGTRLVTAGHEGGVTVWDPVAATPIRQFSVGRSRCPGPPPAGMPPPEVWAVVVALSPDGSRCRGHDRGDGLRLGRDDGRRASFRRASRSLGPADRLGPLHRGRAIARAH